MAPMRTHGRPGEVLGTAPHVGKVYSDSEVLDMLDNREKAIHKEERAKLNDEWCRVIYI